MRYTLLDLTQSILSSMDSDEINSISDTVESQQVVECIKTVYDDLISRGELIISKTLFSLTASGTSLKPVLMTKPTTIDDIDWIRYNKIQQGGTDAEWGEVRYLALDQFMMHTQGLNVSEDNIASMAHTANTFNLTFHYRTDAPPSYYTSFDDNTLIFDSYDSDVDSTLQSTKTLCYGDIANSFTETDGWTPNLQPQQFALLLNEAKALAWAELRQSPHLKAELTARRNWRHLGRSRQQVPTGSFGSGAHPFDKLPDYGRK